MVILRITEGIRTHFPARKSEWLLAAAMTGWGAWLLLWGPDVFVDNRSYATMVVWGRRLAADPQLFWGLATASIGLLRLAALVVNGTFVHTWYGWMSPHIRAALSLVSCGVWGWIALGITFSPGRSTGEVIYAAMTVLDFLNSRDAATDAGAVDRARTK